MTRLDQGTTGSTELQSGTHSAHVTSRKRADLSKVFARVHPLLSRALSHPKNNVGGLREEEGSMRSLHSCLLTGLLELRQFSDVRASEFIDILRERNDLEVNRLLPPARRCFEMCRTWFDRGMLPRVLLRILTPAAPNVFGPRSNRRYKIKNGPSNAAGARANPMIELALQEGQVSALGQVLRRRVLQGSLEPAQGLLAAWHRRASKCASYADYATGPK